MFYNQLRLLTFFKEFDLTHNFTLYGASGVVVERLPCKHKVCRSTPLYTSVSRITYFSMQQPGDKARVAKLRV